ncbi:MAG: OB-fold nucleic acid binding domain-containing protein [Candidatus Thorarchaeota archaeon]
MLTLEQTIELILKHRPELDRKAVMEMIQEKREQMGPDLVNEESAAMIVARDLGIDLQQLSPRPRMKIEEITEGTRSVTLTAKVVGINTVREFSRSGGGTGKVTSITIADDTGKIRVVLWDEMTKVVSDGVVNIGDWIQIRNAYVKRGLRDTLELNLGRMGGFKVLDEYEVKEIDIDVKASDTTKIKDLQEGMYDIALLFSVQRIFGLSTFTRKDGGEGKVLSIIGADETGTTRIVFWDAFAEQMQEAQEGEVIRLSGAYTRKGRYGDVEVHAGRTSTIERNLKESIDVVTPTTPTFEEMGMQPISELTTEMRDVDIEGKVVKIFPVTTFERGGKEGQVQNILVTDGTATVRVTFWNEDVNSIKALEEGDVVRIKHGYVKEGFRGGVEFHVGRKAEIEINPEGSGLKDLDVSQISVTTTPMPKTGRVLIETLDESSEGKNVEVSGIIMAISQRSPVYPACPNCKKKLEEEGGQFKCPACGDVDAPEYRMLYKVTLDDGSGSIPITLFGEAGEQLLGMSAAEAQDLISKTGNPTEPFDKNAHRILGARVVVKGRVTRFRDSTEIAVSALLFPDLAAEIDKESKRVEALME